MKAILKIAGILCLAALLFCGVSADEQAPPQGQPPEGQPPQDCTDYAKAAATLGVTEDALKEAMGFGKAPDQGAREERDAAMAEKLGVSVEDLKAAMGTPGQGEPGQGPDMAAMAEKLGVTEDALKEAMGTPGDKGNHFAEAATTLGVSEDDLKAALDAAKTC